MGSTTFPWCVHDCLLHVIGNLAGLSLAMGGPANRAYKDRALGPTLASSKTLARGAAELQRLHLSLAYSVLLAKTMPISDTKSERAEPWLGLRSRDAT